MPSSTTYSLVSCRSAKGRGRTRPSSDVSEIKLVFSIPPLRSAPNIAPSCNVAPTDPLPVVRYDAKDHQRSLDVMRCELVPFWAKDIKVGLANINAKAEGIEKKPAFREAFRRRRCPVPGRWEKNWRSPAGERIRSFAIVTTELNELCARLHNRMPVVLKPTAWPAWLGEEPADEARLKSLLALSPSDDMVCQPVGARVGNVKNNDPSLIEPLPAAG